MRKERNQKLSLQDIIGILLIGIAVLLLGNSLRLCFSSDIWYDELFTMGMVEHSYRELISFTARDVHPPLYYFIVKFVVDLCKPICLTGTTTAVILAKIVSVLPYFLLLLYVLTFIRKHFGLLTGGLFLFCVTAMPQMSAYTVEIRMYSCALFFVTAAFLHAYGIITSSNKEQKIHWTALLFYGLAAAYTQYFACVAIVMVYLYLLVYLLLQYKQKKEIRNWFFCVAASIIGYLPWIFVLISQMMMVRANYWIQPLTLRSLGGCVKFLLKPAFGNEKVNVVLAVLFFICYIAVFGIWFYAIQKKKAIKSAVKQFGYAIAGVMVLVGLVLFGFAASMLLRPIFVYRYMLPAMGCFWLGFAICLGMLCQTGQTLLKENKMRILQFSIVLLWTVVGLRNYQAFMGEEEYKIVLMQDTEKRLAQLGEEDILLYNFDQLQAVVGYYVNQQSYLWCGTPETLIVDMFGEKGSIEDTRQIQKLLDEGKKVWYLGSFNSREEIRAIWEEQGIHTKEEGSYFLERYWFNLYEVSE